MLKPKQEVISYVRQYGARLSRIRNGLNTLYKSITDRFNIPASEILDIINENINDEDIDDFYLYAICYFLREESDGIDLKSIFTKVELSSYCRRKYKAPEVQFPIRIKCIQITDEQWIGKTDVNFLMLLNHFQMINYNINAQRTMRKVVNGDNISYKIYVNNAAVERIRSAFDDKIYIPDTITLGLVPEADPSFYYDEEENELIIESIKYFDIPDGYHRYLAMIREKETNKSFNYPMELRIINFAEDKTKQFIYQQDQKTKMKRVDSDSMNMNSISNRIVDKLNENSSFYFAGQISRNDAKINYSLLSAAINYYYFKNKTIQKKDQARIIIETVNELCSYFNKIIEANSDLLDKTLSNLEIMFMVYYAKEKGCGFSERKLKEIFGVLNSEEVVKKCKWLSNTTSMHNIIKNIV